MSTPIERAATALRGSWNKRTGYTDYRGSYSPADLEDVRAVFESIDRDELAAFLDSPTHAPMDTHSGRDGWCLDCPWPVHELPPADLADAIIAYLTGDQS